MLTHSLALTPTGTINERVCQSAASKALAIGREQSRTRRDVRQRSRTVLTNFDCRLLSGNSRAPALSLSLSLLSRPSCYLVRSPTRHNQTELAAPSARRLGRGVCICPPFSLFEMTCAQRSPLLLLVALLATVRTCPLTSNEPGRHPVASDLEFVHTHTSPERILSGCNLLVLICTNSQTPPSHLLERCDELARALVCDTRQQSHAASGQPALNVTPNVVESGPRGVRPRRGG